MNHLIYTFAQPNDEPQVRGLLQIAGLPDDDVRPHLRHFLVCKSGESIAGCVGLELAGENALLRSLAVSPPFRSKEVGTELCRRVTEHARSLGYHELFLLTTSAEAYFRKKGYVRIERADAPDGIKATEQFRNLCPDSAVVMRVLI